MSAGTGSGMTSRTVTGDGLDLMVAAAGSAGPAIVFVHGYPDTHEGWLPLIARLSDEFRCVAYDVRGAGRSGAPDSVAGYRIPHLVSDLVAVLDHVGREPVHLVAHDWGSVQTWESVLRAGTDPRLRGRIASFTTISGPAIGHLGAWYRAAGKGASRQRRRAVLRQALHSWYLGAFQVPEVPEAVLRRALADPLRARRIVGMPHLADTYVQDAINGLGLYRANLRGSEHPPTLHTAIPVQLVVPTRDPFLRPAVYEDLGRWCSDLTRHEVDAGHWVPQTHPDQIAELVRGFVLGHQGGPTAQEGT